MIYELVQWDRWLMVLINKTWANSFFDLIMPWLREPKFWIPVYLLILYFTWKQFRRNSWVVVIFAILAVSSADRISSGIFKPGFERPRPCHHQAMMGKIELRKESGCGGKFGFVSSHAANHFALAVFLIIAFARRMKTVWKILLLAWAFIVCYAQVYVGVHFPADVFFGALLGVFIGYIFAIINCKILKPLYQKR